VIYQVSAGVKENQKTHKLTQALTGLSFSTII